jgi:FixJ family two-component response regulator
VVAGSRRVCIVDDDDAVRIALRRLLEAYDFEATSYASGVDFLSHHRRGQFGCLVELPGLSGLEVLSHLRGVANDNTRVIVITGSGDPFLKQRVLTAGASAFLEKPFGAETLVEIVEQLLAG